MTESDAQHQRRFFETFGFVVLRQAFDSDEVKAIDNAFEEVVTERLEADGKLRDTLQEKWAVDPAFCERHPTLLALVDDPRITSVIDNILDPGWCYASSDGHLYRHDTPWHADVGWGPNIPQGRNDPNLVETLSPHYTEGLKVALYLDPIDDDTGALRVVPGTHISPFHEALAPIHNTLADYPEIAADPKYASFVDDPIDGTQPRP